MGLACGTVTFNIKYPVHGGHNKCGTIMVSTRAKNWDKGVDVWGAAKESLRVKVLAAALPILGNLGQVSLAHLSLSSLDCQTAKNRSSFTERLWNLACKSPCTAPDLKFGELLQSLPARAAASVVTGSNKWAGKGAARVEKVALPFWNSPLLAFCPRRPWRARSWGLAWYWWQVAQRPWQKKPTQTWAARGAGLWPHRPAPSARAMRSWDAGACRGVICWEHGDSQATGAWSHPGREENRRPHCAQEVDGLRRHRWRHRRLLPGDNGGHPASWPPPLRTPPPAPVVALPSLYSTWLTLLFFFYLNRA